MTKKNFPHYDNVSLVTHTYIYIFNSMNYVTDTSSNKIGFRQFTHIGLYCATFKGRTQRGVKLFSTPLPSWLSCRQD